ncbi:SdpI family protein [Brevundimonas sp. BH3]|uniref:SdpI family protein n=1 Tax=unclassified Brevundimonas TaxID=2622653 RepID=UPI0028A04830|nr:SdpI family protein [Brevundimonas sp.]
MNPKLHPAHVFGFIVSALILAGAIWVALHGPTGPIPMHFDASGQVDRYGTRYELAAVLAGMSVLNLIVGFLTGKQADTTPDPVRQKALRSGQYVTVAIMAAVAAFISWSSLGPSAASGMTSLSGAMAFMGAVFLALGAILGRVGPNAFIGVRTPWAFKSRLAWDKSNRLAGRLMFWTGLVGLIASPLSPQPFGLIALTVAVVLMAIFSAYESWRVWKNDPEAQSF